MQEIDISKAKGVFAKTLFSMVVPDVEKLLEEESARKSVVLFGIEVKLMLTHFGLYLWS